MKLLAFALARFSEPSSYAGLGAILALAGLHFSDSDLGQLAQFLAAGCGLAALLLKEKGVVQMIALAVLLGATLGACGNPAGTAPTVTPSQLISAGQQAIETTGAVITEAQAGACLVQSIANLTSSIAQTAGDSAVANGAAQASAAAGQVCSWTNPVTTAPAAAPASGTSP